MRMTIGLLIVVLALFGLQGCGSGQTAVLTVTVDQQAGTWDIMGSGTQNVGANQGVSNCPISFAGTLTINTNGSVSTNRTNHTCTADAPISDNTGTLNVSLIGHGTLIFTGLGEVYTIQFSRNLEEAVLADATSGGVFISGMAIRR